MVLLVFRKQMPRTSTEEVLLEKTPSYFITKVAPERIFQMDPQMKLLVVVRDPVTRAISGKCNSPGPAVISGYVTDCF